MFQISLVEHVRLSFGSARAAYEGHADAAATLARRSSQARIALLVVSASSATISAIAIPGGYAVQMVSTILAAATFGACAAYIGWNHQALIYGHRASAARMWVICEKYRGLLADMQEGAVDLPTLQRQRNLLLDEAAAVLQQGAPDDRYSYQIAKEALSGPRGAGYPDALIDRYLPPVLRKQAPAA
jgi:hypothetical protein